MPLRGKKILIIDDSEDIRLFERRVIENLGITVTESTSVDEALKLLDTEDFNLIILDLEMPVKPGFDFLTARSQRTILKEIPVIVVSAHNDAMSIQRAMALGADNFVIKPINPAILGLRVRRHARPLTYMQYVFHSLMPEVSLQLSAQNSTVNPQKNLSLKLLIIEEEGLTLISKQALPKRTVVKLTGLFMGEISKSDEPLALTVITSDLTPDQETYVTYAYFDPTDTLALANTRNWLLQHWTQGTQPSPSDFDEDSLM